MRGTASRPTISCSHYALEPSKQVHHDFTSPPRAHWTCLSSSRGRFETTQKCWISARPYFGREGVALLPRLHSGIILFCALDQPANILNLPRGDTRAAVGSARGLP